MDNPLSATLTPNPFNPGAPVDPNDFVGRNIELELFRQRLIQTSSGSGASMSVIGGYGSGKTSFLHKCKTIAESNNALTVYYSLSELDKLDKATLSNELVERLKEKVANEVVLKKISKTVFDALKKVRLRIGGAVEIQYNGDQIQSYPTLQSALTAAWNDMKGHKTAIVFLIDEAGVLERNKAALIMYLKAVIEQLQAERIPVMMVLGGKLTMIASTGGGFSPNMRAFPPSLMENFSKEECHKFVKKRLESNQKTVSDTLIDMAYEKTEGHPYVLSAYLASAYLNLTPEENVLAKKHFDAADVDFVKRTLAYFFSRFYDNAGRMGKTILEKAAESGGEIGLQKLCEEMKKKNFQLSPYLAKLIQDGAMVRSDRGKYKLFHKLLGNYIVERRR